ncbi:alpha/beta hydrolase [Actinomadura rudentiformis]|uniref:Esterase family protein n=1 Tax=Actinomadura rudentiformis TaxID=359158 RepID=A0A6H9YIA8_9ACTN|nr:alpha/beta hydrolase family protein [Actinomadura rudentiformis]KAB2346354.1 esterase family protein [Actinomadura rudentiformis]
MGRSKSRASALTAALTALVLGIGLVPAMSSASASTTARAAAPVPADDGAQITSERWLDPSTVDLTVQSPAVAQTVTVRVRVPRGWQRDSARTWPVVFALGGGDSADTQATWMESTDIEDVAAQWDALVVMPDPGQAGFTDWYNYGNFGAPAWEKFHTVELRQLIERNFRGGDRRAAIGISSGGLGAITMAGRHPGVFKFAASYSGLLHITMPGVDASLMLLNSSVGDPFRIWGIPVVHGANWRANNPYDLADKFRGTGLYVSSGTTGNRGPLDPTDMTLPEAIRARLVGGVSEQMTGLTSSAFVNRLRSLGIPVTANLYGDGWHQWKYWDREMKASWPAIMQAVDAQRVP